MENSGLQQPGQTITPSSGPASGPASPPTPTPKAPVTPAPVVSAPQPQPPPQPAVPTGLQQTDDEGESFYSGEPDVNGTGSDNSPDASAEISWTASEFVAHEKSAGWYFTLALTAIAISALIYLITRDFVSVGVVVFGALMFGVYGARQPRQLEYRIDGGGVSIGQKYYGFDEFRTFSIIPEGAFSSIVFMPLKRFAPPTTIYYDPKDEERIVSILSNRLPFEEASHDAVDRLMRRIRF